jgi:hypothetical protein
MAKVKSSIYISGKISGTDDYMERFQAAESLLTRLGFKVVNPAKLNAQMPSNTSYRTYMNIAIEALKSCKQIYMLKGWTKSNGARAEQALAKCYDITILYEE